MSNFIEEKSVNSSPIQISGAESSGEEQVNLASNAAIPVSWPKYKHFKDPQTGEEAIYVLLDKPPHRHHHHPQHHPKEREAWKICRQLLDLSSISLFVASNLLAFTVGLLIGKRSAEF